MRDEVDEIGEAEGSDRPAMRVVQRRKGVTAAPASGLHFFGVVRGRGGLRSLGAGDAEVVQRVRYRDLEALVRGAPFELPPLDQQHLHAHQRVVEGAMRRGTILPAPFGVIFRGRRAVIHFLEEQYIVLDEALAFLDGHWELRLHVAAVEPTGGDEEIELLELATHVYSELRRFARAAVPSPRAEGRLFTASFLVDRASWIEFVERTDDLGNAHPELSFDVTGPWPPYDFVRMTV